MATSREKKRNSSYSFLSARYWGVYLSHVDELGEDLRSLLGRVSAEDHQLHPLGDAVAHHNRALQSRVVPHRAMHHVAAVVQELRPSEGVTGSSCSDADEIHLTSVTSFNTKDVYKGP